MGEAGIGKSALLDYAATRADGLRVLRGRGVESESEFPFAAVHQLLRPVQDRIGLIPARQRAALHGAFGLADAGDDRFLVSMAVLSVLAEVAEKQPLLCLVDDAQWLDGASADALLFAARRLEAEGIVLLFAVRDDAAAGFPAPVLPDLRLSGLDPAAAAALLAEGRPVADRVRDVLVASTAGNPLGLVELPGSLTAGQLAGREPLPDRLPVGRDVEQVFLGRVHREPAETQTLLLVAAAEDTGDLAVVLRAAETLGVGASALDRRRDRRIRPRRPRPRSRSATRWCVRRSTGVRRSSQQRAVRCAGGGADRRRGGRPAGVAPGGGRGGPGRGGGAGTGTVGAAGARRGGHAAAATAYERAAALTTVADQRARRLVDAAAAAWLAGHTDRAGALDRAARFDRSGRTRRGSTLRGLIASRVRHARHGVHDPGRRRRSDRHVRPVEGGPDAAQTRARPPGWAATPPGLAEAPPPAGRLRRRRTARRPSPRSSSSDWIVSSRRHRSAAATLLRTTRLAEESDDVTGPRPNGSRRDVPRR